MVVRISEQNKWVPSDRPLYIFVDESGNFDFSPSGTNHFVLGAVATTDPAASAARIQQVKYRLWAEGHEVDSFHAAEDRQVVRDVVLAELGRLREVKIHAIYGDKHRAAPSKQSDEAIYTLFGQAQLRYFLRVYAGHPINRVVVVFDRTLTGKRRGSFEQAIKPVLKATGLPFAVWFHQMATDLNGQIADYVSWSRYVAAERSEWRPWHALRPAGATDFNIFRRGHTRYY